VFAGITNWLLWRDAFGATVTRAITRQRRASRKGSRFSRSESIPLLFNMLLLLLCCRIVDKLEGTWRSGGADGSLVYVLREIRHIIVGDEQRGAAKMACPRKCRYGLRVEFSPRHWGGGLRIGRPSVIHTISKEMEGKGPRRATKRREGLKVNQRPQGKYPLRPGQPGGSCSARNRQVPRISMDRGRVAAYRI